jgi:hypothetical protein
LLVYSTSESAKPSCLRELIPSLPNALVRCHSTSAPVPYVQAQVGHEDATTTLKIYAEVLKRRDCTRHGQAFDALMTTAVPSGASIIMQDKPSTSATGTAATCRPFPADLATETSQPTIL